MQNKLKLDARRWNIEPGYLQIIDLKNMFVYFFKLWSTQDPLAHDI